MAVRSRDFYKDLKQLIHFPDNCVEIKIHLPPGGVVAVECTYLPDLEPHSAVTMRYTLEPIPTSPPQAGAGGA